MTPDENLIRTVIRLLPNQSIVRNLATNKTKDCRVVWGCGYFKLATFSGMYHLVFHRYEYLLLLSSDPNKVQRPKLDSCSFWNTYRQLIKLTQGSPFCSVNCYQHMHTTRNLKLKRDYVREAFQLAFKSYSESNFRRCCKSPEETAFPKQIFSKAPTSLSLKLAIFLILSRFVHC